MGNCVSLDKPNSLKYQKILSKTVGGLSSEFNHNQIKTLTSKMNSQDALFRQLQDQPFEDQALQYHQNQALSLIQQQDMQRDHFHFSIGALICQTLHFSKKQIKGTGTLIASNIVLTSAHNVYNKKQSIEMDPKKMKFYPGVNGKMGRYYQIQRFMYPKEFELKEYGEFDYALLKLKERVEIKYPIQMYLGFNFHDKAAMLHIYGYPGDAYAYLNKDKPSNENRAAYQRGLSQSQKLLNIQQNIISYDIATLEGQSGCPVITGHKKNIIVGVHKASGKENNSENKKKVHFGRYVNIDMILRLEVWRQLLKGDQFKVMDMQKDEQIKMNSPLLVELTAMVKRSIQMNIRIKTKYEILLNGAEQEYNKLKDKIEKNGGENVSFEKLMDQKEKQGQKIKELNEGFQREIQKKKEVEKQLNLKKKELGRKIEEVNQLKSLRGRLKNVEEQRDKEVQRVQQFKMVIRQKDQNSARKQQRVNVLEKQLQNCQNTLKIVNKQVAQGQIGQIYQFLWDKNSTYASKFSIDYGKVELRIDDNLYQLTSEKPLPHFKKTTINFHIIKYGGDFQLCFGVLIKSRKEALNSGTEKGSAAYFTRNGKKKADGWLNINGEAKGYQQQNLFVPQGSYVETIVDLLDYKITFINWSKDRICCYSLGPQFKTQDIYIFSVMRLRLDCLRVE